ncbi:PAAR domain-containing protein [Pseudomonas sp. NPDC099000]|uniref:PAAR domain-containing protein n=1 Tax=Pseudomonas sp. NPDC099000 TaxID=3364488 RepID=UPI00383AB9DA
MAGKPVARLGDPGSHGGNISTGSSPIFVNTLPIALVGDIYSCPLHGSNPITTGAPHVFGLGKDVAHVGSLTAAAPQSRQVLQIHLSAMLGAAVSVIFSANFCRKRLSSNFNCSMIERSRFLTSPMN